MSNFLENGAVLPHGLLTENASSMMEGFNKSYKNYPLRVGLITETYPVSDQKNKSKLTTEYDVLIIEQHEDKGATTIQYRNCMSAEGLGSIADFFERTLRKKKKKTTKGDSTNLKGQNGAIVLLLCLDGMSDKGIILGGLTHPDRKTTLMDSDPYLEGEYNGVNIKVLKDGSATFTFKGATDNDGKIIDSSQGITTLKVEKDGSFQVNNDSTLVRLDRTGQINITGKKDIVVTTDTNVNVTCVDATITASGNMTATISKNLTVKCKEALIEASGSATVEGKEIKLGTGASESVVKGDLFKKYFSTHTHTTNTGPSGPPIQPFDPSLLSKKVKTE